MAKNSSKSDEASDKRSSNNRIMPSSRPLISKIGPVKQSSQSKSIKAADDAPLSTTTIVTRTTEPEDSPTLVAREHRVNIQPTPAFSICTRIVKDSQRSNNNNASGNSEVVYINVCSHPRIPPPPPEAKEEEIQRAINADPTATWQVPMFLSNAANNADIGRLHNRPI